MSDNLYPVETLSDNPNFVASMSSDEIYLGQDMTVCLTDVVNGKAEANHTHSGYATTSHTHTGYASQSDLDLLEDVVDTKANATHTHSDYASTSHTHSDYATVVALDTLGEEVDGKANATHTHTEYATSSHTHSDYAATNHDHDEDYAAIDHTHSIYATTTALNEVSSAVSGKANASHSHDDVYYTETEVDTKLAGKSDTSHNHTGVYDVSGAATNALASANAYTDSKIDALVGEGASTTLDTIGEISSAIEDNQDAIDLLNSAIGTKANATDLTAHTSNTSNPHGVTLSQLGVSATATELNYVDGVTSNIQTQLNAKASSSHTHSYAGSSSVGGAATSANKLNTNAGSTTQPVYFANGVPVATTYSLGKSVPSDAKFTDTTYGVATTSANGLLSASDKAKLDGIASGANAYTLPSAGSALGGVKTGGDVTISSGVITVNDDSHNHVISNVDGLQTALDGKAASSHTHTNYADVSHKHYAQEITVAGEDLNNYTDAGIYTFAQAYAPTNVPAGTNGWLVVMPWAEDGGTIKQLWFRHGTSGTNDHETYVRTKISNVDTWSSWSKYYTTSNPPTAAEVGASPAFTNTSGGVEYSYNTSSGKNVIDEINTMPQGVHTIYSQGGVSGNPKTTESWRLLVHKTSATIGWIVAFGSSGSIYANYQNAAGSFTGWTCVYEATNKMILWSGASYLTSTNSVPQVVTPSKKLSDCRTGWLLLWSDYDASTSTANDNDFCTTFIPKWTPSGGTWGGKAFLCSLPTYVGGDVTDLSTQITVIKPIYVHDDKLVGSYQNTTGGRNDVVLRAVYEV